MFVDGDLHELAEWIRHEQAGKLVMTLATEGVASEDI